MKKTRYNLRHHEHVPYLGTVVQVLPKLHAQSGVAVPLENVIPDPFPEVCCKECRVKPEDKGHEPKNIYADVG